MIVSESANAAPSILFPIPVPESSSAKWVDPFSRVPQPQALGESGDSDGNESQGDQGKYVYAVFNHPASFELTASPSYEARSAVDVAVIYEGMALQMDKSDGRYRLRMVIETPPTNVTLRLQLGVLRQCPVLQPYGGVAPAPVRVGTITLPPIQFEGAAQATRIGQPRLWKIQHDGHSPLLKCQPEPAGCTAELSFVRMGTAEFGVVPQR